MVWPIMSKATEERARAAVVRRRLKKQREMENQLDEAFLFERRVDHQTYERKRDMLRAQISDLELELVALENATHKPDQLLSYSRAVLVDPAGTWASYSGGHKRRLQNAIFPMGVTYQAREFGTA
jgi:hypothetical protein